MSLNVSEANLNPWVWYCARTQPKHEHIAAANVAKRLGVEVFHPRLRIEKATRRGVVTLVEPLFPCYIFVRCNRFEGWDQVKYVHGISSLVSFGGHIPLVPDETIEELKQCFGCGDTMSVEDRLTPGTEVTVKEGALLGAKGIVVRVMPARQRVQILLDFLGRTTLTEVDRKSLQTENRSLADLMPSLAVMQRPEIAVAV